MTMRHYIWAQCDDDGYMRWSGDTIWRARGFHALRAKKAVLSSPVLFPMHNCNRCAVWVMQHRPFWFATIEEVSIDLTRLHKR